MTTCGDGDERVLPEIPSVGDLPSEGEIDEVVLIRRPDQSFKLTAVDSRDVHSAITHGLATYLASLSRSHGGMEMAFQQVTADWADREDGEHPLPSAGVHSEEEGNYEDSGTKPSPPEILDASEPSRVLAIVSTATYRLESLMVDVACSSKVQREGVRRMLEDGANPFEWMGGFRLVLRSYHSAIAGYSLTSCTNADDPDTVSSNIRGLRMKWSAWCQVYRLHRLPLARPMTRGNISSRG